MENWILLATLLSPIVGVLAIVVALFVARRSSKDAQQQIEVIHALLEVFIAAHNLDILENKRKYERRLQDLDRQIESLEESVNIANPFIGGVLIDRIEMHQEGLQKQEKLYQLLEERKELLINLNILNNYIKKASKR